MKTGILIILLFTICACQKEEPFTYTQQQDCVYFKDKSVEKNFAKLKIKKNGKDTYVGDSLRDITVEVPILLLGYRADYARRIFFKTIPLANQDSTRLAEVEVLGDTLVLDSAKAEFKVRVKLKRPEERQYDYQIGLTFDLEKMEFAPGVYEKQIYAITLRDKYTKPMEWDDFFAKYLGEWSPSKHAFVLTYFQEEAIPGYNSPIRWERSFHKQLKAALNEYNEANPDHPKDFTFPEL